MPGGQFGEEGSVIHFRLLSVSPLPACIAKPHLFIYLANNRAETAGVDTGFFDWGGYAMREKWVCGVSLSLEYV